MFVPVCNCDDLFRCGSVNTDFNITELSGIGPANMDWSKTSCRFA